MTLSIAQVNWHRKIRWVVASEVEKMWKEAAVAKFKILRWHLPWGAGENDEKIHSRQPVSKPIFDLGTSDIWNKNANHSDMTFGALIDSVEQIRSLLL
jgi:hypothetical protein